MTKKKSEKKEIKAGEAHEASEVVEVADVSPVLSSDSITKELLEKNLKWSQLIYEQNKKIKRRLTIMVVMGYLKLLIVVVPLVLAAIYLPPLLNDAFTQYQQLLGGVSVENGELDVASIISSLSEDQMGVLLDLVTQ